MIKLITWMIEIVKEKSQCCNIVKKECIKIYCSIDFIKRAQNRFSQKRSLLKLSFHIFDLFLHSIYSFLVNRFIQIQIACNLTNNPQSTF